MTQNKTMENYLKPFIPGKGYRGICIFCGEEFYGRLNKLYHYECKIALNNQKASKVNRSIDPLKRVIIKNDRILKSFYYDSLDQKGLEIDVLIKHGFESKVFTGVFEDDGHTYYRINKFVYTIDESTRKVLISSFLSLKIKTNPLNLKR
jgi:hypothetical protein